MDTETDTRVAALEAQMESLMGPFGIGHGLGGLQARLAALEAHMNETKAADFITVPHVTSTLEAAWQALTFKAILRRFTRPVRRLFSRNA